MTTSPSLETAPKPLLYGELADWWPLLSAPEDYAEEAALFRDVLLEAGDGLIRSVLELGCGGGNNASHLSRHFKMTLADVSPQMVEVSRRLNSGCEHYVGDMRSITLDGRFDAVFVHDAVMYMTRRDDLAAVFTNSRRHLRPGGVALFVPDFVKETFVEYTSEGGHDGKVRSLRYLQWVWDPDPSDTTCCSEFAYLLHDDSGSRCVYDRHTFGLFSKTAWLDLMKEAGFEPGVMRYTMSDASGRKPLLLFVGRRTGE